VSELRVGSESRYGRRSGAERNGVVGASHCDFLNMLFYHVFMSDVDEWRKIRL